MQTFILFKHKPYIEWTDSCQCLSIPSTFLLSVQDQTHSSNNNISASKLEATILKGKEELSPYLIVKPNRNECHIT